MVSATSSRIVFNSRKKTLKKGEIVNKKFVLSEDTFMFGPLLCGKTRERWGARTYQDVLHNQVNRKPNITWCFVTSFPGIGRAAILRTWRQ